MMQSIPQRKFDHPTLSSLCFKLERCLMVMIIGLKITALVGSVGAQNSGYRAQVGHDEDTILEASKSNQIAAGRLKAQTVTAASRQAAAAEQAIAEAERLRGQWTAASLAQAVGKYQEARRYLQSTGDRARDASILKAIGDVYVILSQNR